MRVNRLFLAELVEIKHTFQKRNHGVILVPKLSPVYDAQLLLQGPQLQQQHLEVPVLGYDVNSNSNSQGSASPSESDTHIECDSKVAQYSNHSSRRPNTTPEPSPTLLDNDRYITLDFNERERTRPRRESLSLVTSSRRGSVDPPDQDPEISCNDTRSPSTAPVLSKSTHGGFSKAAAIIIPNINIGIPSFLKHKAPKKRMFSFLFNSDGSIACKIELPPGSNIYNCTCTLVG